MAAHEQRSEVVVAGGGVIGLACAWRLAQTGRAVTVCDPGTPRGASQAAAGMLAPATEATIAERDLLALNLASADRWAAFADELARASAYDPRLRPSGALLVARDGDDAAVLDWLADAHARLGLSSRRLRSRQARELEPGLSPRTRGALMCDGDHQVDNRAVLAGLRRAVEAMGVTFVSAAVSDVRAAGGHVTGVGLSTGASLACEQVVIAAGWRSAQIAGVGTVPVRPVKGQLLHLRVVGATVEERDHDTATTAGGVLQLLRDAWELLPDVGELELTEATAGLRPTTPDNGPVIGHGDIDGVVCAFGHHRHGILLTPITAEAVAALVAGEAPPPEVAPFTPDRFAAKAA
ncbi:MAG: glycine oxidase ThiO [Actinobacteria bacterium QS_8_72_14]|nr:MAG: glycine oxidase ThiO [Actinobacteria bacterium QS_8_72_14]